MASNAPENDAPDNFDLTILHHGKTHAFSFAVDATVTDLTNRVLEALSIPTHVQKFLIAPKVGLLKTPFADPELRLITLRNKKIQLLAPTPAELSSLAHSFVQVNPTARPSSLKSVAPARQRDWRKIQDEATYTFQALIPLPYLPNPQRSLRFLESLRDDAGIKASMRKHKFSVGVLTEMNPAEHTTHESRTLGLNRNRGEVIELRLRTDAYDGYRDYKVIRKTLCHELAHNIFGEHDRNFWNLTGEIEKEVEANDWRSGGHALSNEEFYDPNDRGIEGAHVDGGGWTGGEFVLGTSGTGDGRGSEQGMNRRELMARAAEGRVKREKESGGGEGASPG